MSNLVIQISPMRYARIGGLLYLLIIILGIVNEIFIRNEIVAVGNADATAVNLRSMDLLWRTGIAIKLFMAIINTCLVFVEYILLKPVNKNLALLALCFNLIATGVGVSYALEMSEALFPLGNEGYLQAFTPQQLHAMASTSIKSYSTGFGLELLLFGPAFFVTGYLIIKSTYIPKLIGFLFLITGLSYTISSFSLILAPLFAQKYYFTIAGPAVIGELSLSLWLLIKGVNLESWMKMTQED